MCLVIYTQKLSTPVTSACNGSMLLLLAAKCPLFGMLELFHNMGNLLMPNDHYSGRTAPLTSKRYILYIYSTDIGTEYFKHGIYSPFFPLQNAVCFINLTYLVPVLFIFYIQDVLKFKKNNSGTKRLSKLVTM